MATSLEEEGTHTEKIPMTEENFDGRNSPSNADDIIPHKELPTLLEILRDFTQNTTFHGVRLIFKDHVGIVRRIIWFLLFLTCTVLMIIQISNRVIHYYSYPININYDVNFQKMMSFPTVTICNQNKFRSSAVFRRGWNQMMGDMHSSNSVVDEVKLAEYNASSLNLDEIYHETAHRKQDLIYACEWQNEACGPLNFTEVTTDQGVCYSFNYNRESTLSTASTGPGSGLKLTLNVEQYEYMVKPNAVAGIKLLLHDRQDLIKIAEQGLVLTTGTHAFVGIQLQKVTNLPEPHGICQSKPSLYYQQYSPDACHLTCMTKVLDGLCGCRHVYLPNNGEGSPIVCNLEQYFGCLRDAIVTAMELTKDKCTCPAPCDYLIYVPTVSYGSTSKYTTDGILSSDSAVTLRKRFLQTRETAFRMSKLDNFKRLSAQIKQSLSELQSNLNKNSKHVQSQKNILLWIHDVIKTHFDHRKYLLEWQKFHVEENFVAAKKEMEEKIVSFLGFGFPDLIFQIEFKIKQIAQVHGDSTISDDAKVSMYTEVLNLINARIELVEKILEDYKKLYDAYKSGEPIYTRSFQNESFKDTILMTPILVLNESLTRDEIAFNDNYTFEENLQDLKSDLLRFVSLAKTSYNDGNLIPEEISALRNQFLEKGQLFYLTKRAFISEIVEYPLKVMQENVVQFDQGWQNFENSFQFMLNRTLLLLNNFEKNSLSILETNIARTDYYTSYNNATMVDIAEMLTSENTQKGINEAHSIFNELRSRGQEVFTGWTVLHQSINAIKEMLLDDTNLADYYTSKNISITDVEDTFNEVSSQLSINYARPRSPIILDTSFLNQLDRLIKEMKIYLNGTIVDNDFIKNNFLQLDIYYKEKGYQQFIQQPTYDAFDLFCDIGGTLALFLGASLLTFCEILDLLFHHAIYRITHNDKIH